MSQAGLLHRLTVLALNGHQSDAAACPVLPMHLIKCSSHQRMITLLRDDADALAEVGDVPFGFDPRTFYGDRFGKRPMVMRSGTLRVLRRMTQNDLVPQSVTRSCSPGTSEWWNVKRDPGCGTKEDAQEVFCRNADEFRWTSRSPGLRRVTHGIQARRNHGKPRGASFD